MIVYALLAHEDEDALLQQVRNIKKYNKKDTCIILYNGGTNPKFGMRTRKKEKIKICPYSRPFEPTMTGRMFYDVARWLEEEKVKYNYLVYMEYDMMFVNHGYEAMLEKAMVGYDCMWKFTKTYDHTDRDIWKPAEMLLEEREYWKDILPSKIYRTSNPLQCYRRKIVKKMLDKINNKRIEEFFSKVKVRNMGEMLYPTLAVSCNAKFRRYPSSFKKFLRWKPALTLKEVKKAKKKDHVYVVHPIKDKEVRKWIYKH
ncbi:hypothetical protein [Ammoniphilus sp. CFH 90114]|uniref:hypothetical protein n=1 Tax=Ammoniphilus sp. CFH 90114 TaxID=2493665 RepID=UPI001026A8EA|nr:hypothetical protein [Ammoniphilus sp. CFH 90114]RXT13980.1 hypothetical protein EIZ39_07550 [Ammoniphilus sp. CFH 90114]